MLLDFDDHRLYWATRISGAESEVECLRSRERLIERLAVAALNALAAASETAYEDLIEQVKEWT
jgi:hypothetical protein